MARKKVELFIEIHNEKDFHLILKTNKKFLICKYYYILFILLT